MMNNKGVTLIELLIVIVVIGIISAFAVPAVGSFLETAQRQAVYQDAVAVRNAAANYCAQPTVTCTSTQELTMTELATYLDGFDKTKYDVDDTGTDDLTIATGNGSGGWTITLEAVAVNQGDFEWVTSTDPVNADSSTTYVTEDDN
ncbi:prepilin-type N-terminal cleavage/methylation domain-containing protein [Candidatus Xianfuyuplasma coldseepsis]|uniref:Prepilin-type N-terminal cleavage/methylation domain-containing protein n=1 Tax=Candidatus Xianfuyuplasma coldseepsis TaxID=2782163 RepID=A0A7L7KTA3_9MOLU|nr:prepilin-type N-terminal cleavage/methylation domain-containing protein [Xianfuyuplasma coldseepsis]QMS85927.1 prepilin-type N-terminal cleavage/methylation domain-containing protein [Xianfuyuplasma coldseepsis]